MTEDNRNTEGWSYSLLGAMLRANSSEKEVWFTVEELGLFSRGPHKTILSGFEAQKTGQKFHMKDRAVSQKRCHTESLTFHREL